jgi:general secretion pathway protein K
VLILALWSISFLATLAASVGYGARQRMTLLARIEAADTLYGIAAAGVEQVRALFQTEDVDPGLETLAGEWAYSERLFKEVPMVKGSFSVMHAFTDPVEGEEAVWWGLVDEERKLNLNTWDTAAITRLLISVGGVEAEDAEPLAYAIVDWRDQDSVYQHPEHGAEDDDYEDLKPPYESKDAPFEVLEELLLVKGMTRGIFDKIEPFVTVYGDGHVNFNTAPVEVLMAMGLDERTALAVEVYRRGTDAKPRTADDRYFMEAGQIADVFDEAGLVDAAAINTIAALVGQERIATDSLHYRVRSTGVLDATGARMTVEAVVDRKGKVLYSRVSRTQWPSD